MKKSRRRRLGAVKLPCDVIQQMFNNGEVPLRALMSMRDAGAISPSCFDKILDERPLRAYGWVRNGQHPRMGHITDDENHAVRRALSETEARCKYEWKDARKSTCLYAVEAIKSKLRYYGFRV